MPGVVVAADDPSVVGHDNVGDGAVVRAGEGERPRPAGVREDLADRGAVAENGDARVAVAGSETLDRIADAGCEPVRRLGTGDDIPALLGPHLEGDGMAVRDVLAEAAALPFTEVHLAQVRFDDRMQSQPL